MRDIRAAYAAFWGSFYNRGVTTHIPIPAYQEGFAVEYTAGRPTAPPYPYITYDLGMAAFADFTLLTGRIWTSQTSFGLVDDVLAQAQEKIPEHGAELDLGELGRIIFYRSNPFIQYLPSEDDNQMLRTGIISVLATNYIY